MWLFGINSPPPPGLWCRGRLQLWAFLGILFFLLSAKKALEMKDLGRNWALIRSRRKERTEHLREMEARFPSVTSEQEAILSLGLAELSGRLRAGSLSSVEVVQAYLAAAVRANRDTNAVVEFLPGALEEASARDEADDPEREKRPLHGVPFSVKGRVSTSGVAANLSNAPAAIDASVVSLLRSLGAVPFCRTNCAQLCLSFGASNPVYGATRNPADPERTPGGSSSGEGALVASGGSVLGIGSDLGGSLRAPAAFCGICTLKPTAGRLPNSGQFRDGGLPGIVGASSTAGFLCRTAADLSLCVEAAVREAAGGACKTDPRLAPVPWRKSEPGKKYKVGWYDDDGFFEATPGARRAVREAANLLTSAGHKVVYWRPPCLSAAFAANGAARNADAGRTFVDLLRGGPVDSAALGPAYWSYVLPGWVRDPLSRLVSLWSPLMARLVSSRGCRTGAEQLWQLNSERLQLAERVLREWCAEGFDVVITPGMSMPAPPLGYPAYQYAAMSYLSVYNVLNFPAGSVPVTRESEIDQALLRECYPGWERDLMYGWTKRGAEGAAGLPLNVQVAGRPWSEETVLAVMREVEEEGAKKRRKTQ